MSVAAAVLAGCAASDKLGSSGDSGSALGNLLAFNTLHPGLAPKPEAVEKPVQCPLIEVQDGTSAYRTYVGQDQSNANVRYQFSMGEVARECQRSGGQLMLKVGVAGRVLLGPAGAPGSFTVPVRVAVRRESDQKPALSKLYDVPATIAAGQDATDFQLVTEPLAVPFVTYQADADYTILVGFDAGRPGGTPATATGGKRHRGRAAPAAAAAGAAPNG